MKVQESFLSRCERLCVLTGGGERASKEGKVANKITCVVRRKGDPEVIGIDYKIRSQRKREGVNNLLLLHDKLSQT